MIDPLLEPRPAFDEGTAASLLSDQYGIDGALSELHGERDLNFRVDADGGARYLLKIHNPADPPDVIEMRASAMEHIGRVDETMPLPRLVPTSDGAPGAAAVGSDGRRSEVQVFTFLDGHHPAREELGENELFEWGRFVARLGRALRGFFHPAARYRIQWDLRHTASLRDRVTLLDGRTRALVEEAVDRFASNVEPRFDALRAQFVHNDLSRTNVLVDDRGSIVGVTDFGDATHTALVCDLAVSMADVLSGRPDSLAMAEAMVAGYCDETPLEASEAQVLGDLVAARAATDVVVTTWRAGHHAHATEVPTGAVELLEIFGAEGFEAVATRFARAARRASTRPRGELPYARRSSADLLAARRRAMGPLELSYEEPVHLVRGEGVHLFDAEGRRYIDAYNNVPVLGHCHPAVTSAVAAQASLLVTNTRYLHEASVELAERLLQRAPGHLERVLFVNSGSEANDVAWRIATFATGGDGAIVTRNAYHGITEATTDLSPDEWSEAVVPSHVGLLAPPGAASGGVADAPPGVAGRGGRAGRDAGGSPDEVLGMLRAAGHSPAALFVDPAFMSDGVLGPAHDWIATVVAAVREAGALFVADEVQAGFGRTGSGLWSISPSGVEPDFVAIGKPMGNGFPVAALLGRADLVDPFMEATGYFSTFGGNTLACAAALAVLRVVESERLVAHAADVGAYLRGLLDEVVARHEMAGALRGWGLVFGLDVVGEGGEPDPIGAARVTNGMRRLGVLVGITGPTRNVVKIRPPLVFGKAEAVVVAERLDEVLDVVAAGGVTRANGAG